MVGGDSRIDAGRMKSSVLAALGAGFAVVFGLWVLLLLYIVLSIIAAIWEGLQA